MSPGGVPSAQASRSLIYRSSRLYEFAMLSLYGRHYRARHSVIATLIPPGSSVVELCCGPGVLYSRHLKGKNVRYLGLDYSPAFIESLHRRGVDAQLRDLRDPDPLPPADYLIMQASLYHFLPAPQGVLERMLAAARARVIVAEPVRNLTTDHPMLGRLTARATDPGTGAQAARFDEDSLARCLEPYRELVEAEQLIPGGREKLYVLSASGQAAGPADRRLSRLRR